MTTCTNCWGTGEVVFCCDGICQGLGYCIHGDGTNMCEECNGWGEFFDEDNELDAACFYENEEAEL